MNILGIDTSTEACSVALLTKGEVIQRFTHQPQKQATLLLPELEALLSAANVSISSIDALAFCHGPGSFTGLRVAVAAAQGIAIAHDLPMIGVSTLKTLAYGEFKRTNNAAVAACIDARMQEVYQACYDFSDMEKSVVTEDQVLPPKEVVLPASSKWSMVGNGWSVYAEEFQFQTSLAKSSAWPEAAHLVELAKLEYEKGNCIKPEQAQPVYLRNNVAKKKANQ